MRLPRSSGRAFSGFMRRASLSRPRISFASRCSIPSSEPRAGLFIACSQEVANGASYAADTDRRKKVVRGSESASCLLCLRGRLRTRQQFAQVRPGEVATVRHNRGDLLRVANVVQRIRVEQDQVGEFSLFDGSEAVVHAEKPGGIQRGGLQSFHGRKTGGDESLEFFVQAEAGEYVDAWRRVGP